MHINSTLIPFGLCVYELLLSYQAQSFLTAYFFRRNIAVFFSARIVNIWNSLPNSVVDACTVNAFKARLDKFWKHRSVKFDFTADLTGTGNRSEEVIK